MIRSPIRRRKLVLVAISAFTVFFFYGRFRDAVSDAQVVNDLLESERKPPDAYSHPLENSCHYPILFPEDPNLKNYIRHGRKVKCRKVQPDLITWDSDSGILKLNRPAINELSKETNSTITCYYQTFAGGVVPKHRAITPSSNLTLLEDDRVRIEHDMVRVECNTSSSDYGDPPETVYHSAFSQVAVRTGRFAPSTPTRLSLNILVLDSTSLNMFRRHAPSSWTYMTEKMGFFTFDGFTKVGDNSLVNLLPLLTGLRYKSMSHDMPSDLPITRPLHSDKTPFLWHRFKAKNCATLFNDDIAHPARGFMNYPFDETPGFKTKPTEHFYRPWHLYHRSRPVANSSQFCFGNEPYYKQQLSLTKQMIKKYSDTCHFSFNFLTDLTHDDTNRLEAVDEELLRLLKDVHESGRLKNTALVVMGDHGNRIGLIRYSYVGRIEERMPFFALYLPEHIRRSYPRIVENLRINRHRLVTHFDAHQMFNDILDENFSGEEPATTDTSTTAARSNGNKNRSIRGISLFRAIPAKRDCAEANIPHNFCVCMIRNRTMLDRANDTKVRTSVEDLLTRWVSEKFADRIARCQLAPIGLALTDLSAWTTNQYVQHGVRNITDKAELAKSLEKKYIAGDIEYARAEFVASALGVRGIAQFQHNKILKKVRMTHDPLIEMDAKQQLKRCVEKIASFA